MGDPNRENRGKQMRFTSFLRAGLVAAALLGTSQAFAYVASGADGTGQDRPLASPVPRETVSYNGSYPPGSIIVNTSERRLYFVLPGHQALKYGVGVGRPGFTWAGVTRIGNKREWPDWTPPSEMLKRRPDLPRHMKGGIENPLGARAMYLAASTARTSPTRSAKPSPRAAFA
jgi:lipoprotein-anchoring transpeptidase ErfK/SrfK